MSHTELPHLFEWGHSYHSRQIPLTNSISYVRRQLLSIIRNLLVSFPKSGWTKWGKRNFRKHIFRTTAESVIYEVVWKLLSQHASFNSHYTHRKCLPHHAECPQINAMSLSFPTLPVFASTPCCTGSSRNGHYMSERITLLLMALPGAAGTSQDLRDSEFLLFDTYFLSYHFKCIVEGGLTVKALFPQHS